MFSNKVYDVLKWVAQIVIPALGTCYAIVSGLWKWPNTEEVVGTLMAVDALLGAVLGLSSKSYNNSDEKYDGVINIVPKPGGGVLHDMQLTKIEDPSDIDQQEQLLFKVNKPA